MITDQIRSTVYPRPNACDGIPVQAAEAGCGVGVSAASALASQVAAPAASRDWGATAALACVAGAQKARLRSYAERHMRSYADGRPRRVTRAAQPFR
jgi:hypothetical protein